MVGWLDGCVMMVSFFIRVSVKFRMLIVLFSGMDIACCLCFLLGLKDRTF